MRHSTSQLVAPALAPLVEDLGEGIWVLDRTDGTIRDLNDPAAASVGRTADELLGSPFGQLLDPPMAAEAWPLLLARSEHAGHRIGVELACDDVALRVQLLLVALDEQHVAALTRRVDLDRLLGEDLVRDQLDVVLGGLGLGVAIVDPHGRIALVNESLESLLGLGRTELLGRSVLDPPWDLRDEHGQPLAPERQPGAVALRDGRAADTVASVTLADGSTRWLHVRARPLASTTGPVVVELSDLSERRQLALEVERLRNTDALTGLATRQRIIELLDASIDAAERDGDRVGVLHVDLDSFRSINDTFGATVGDTVLRTICSRFSDLADRHVELGRIGVDEFLVVVRGTGPGVAFDARLRRLAEEIQRRTEQTLSIDGLELRSTASIGVSRWPGDGEDSAALQRAADRALTAGRRDGRHQLRFYERSLDERTRTGLALDRDLRRAAAQRELEVHYQPIIDLRSGQVAAAEALVRWHHPTHGPVPPSVFIPTAEATGAISAISDLVMTTVAQDLAEWNAAALLPEGTRIAVNISAAEFAQRGFVERLARTLDRVGVSPSQIELEITETLLMSDLDTTAERLSSLDALGFLVALDDFGTGYSSLSYLHSLPLHTLKVDRCFVGDLRDGRSETITRAILSLAHGLGIVAVGEGVETDEQRQFLLDAGCDLVQGFYFAPPLPRAAFEHFLAEQGDREPEPSAGRAGD